MDPDSSSAPKITPENTVAAKPSHVVIVGGGVIGTFTGWYLQQAGANVTIIDTGDFEAGCSHGNCGLICPSHVLPLAEPGAVRKSLGALISPNSPFSIKPRLSPALWSWLIKFALRCNKKDMLASGHAIAALLESSRHLYNDLMQTPGLCSQAQWQEKGLLFAYVSEKLFHDYAKTDALLRSEFDHGAEAIPGNELASVEPALVDDLAGGWLYHDDAHLRPNLLMSSLQTQLRSEGVTFVSHRKLVSLERTATGKAATEAKFVDARSEHNQQESQTFTADAFVLATGALTPKLQELVGGQIPIQPGKGYSVTHARPEICPAIPMIFPETKVAVTPFADGIRLGSTMEFAGYDDAIHARRLNLLYAGSQRYLRSPLEPAAKQETWFGWRPMTYDGMPLIGPCQRYENVFLAAGHGMLGVSMGPATGKLVAELVLGKETHLDASPYRPARF